jgi:hypothetical protein
MIKFIRVAKIFSTLCCVLVSSQCTKTLYREAQKVINQSEVNIKIWLSSLDGQGFKKGITTHSFLHFR